MACAVRIAWKLACCASPVLPGDQNNLAASAVKAPLTGGARGSRTPDLLNAIQL
jgi:hypothetical protein